MSQYPVQCLYCEKRTGLSSERGRLTVCYSCAWSQGRDEAREIAAGMTPWSRPLNFWVRFLGWKTARMGPAREKRQRERKTGT